MKLFYNVILFSFLSLHPFFSFSSENKKILMPSAKIIHERLANIGLDFFMEKTKIVDELANQKKYPVGVAVTLDFALYNYSKYVKDPMITETMDTRRDSILRTLLIDHPEAIKELEDQGALSKE